MKKIIGLLFILSGFIYGYVSKNDIIIHAMISLSFAIASVWLFFWMIKKENKEHLHAGTFICSLLFMGVSIYFIKVIFIVL